MCDPEKSVWVFGVLLPPGGTASGGQVFGNRVRRVQTGNRAGAPHIAPPTPQIRALPPQLLAPPRYLTPLLGSWPRILVSSSMGVAVVRMPGGEVPSGFA